MAKYWRGTIAALVLSGTGCCHNCGCCDSWNAHDKRPPMRLDEGPPPMPVRTPSSEVIPPVGPRPGIGAYGGSGS